MPPINKDEHPTSGLAHTQGVWRTLSATKRKGRAKRNGHAIWNVLEERTNPTLMRPKLQDDIERRLFRLRWGNDYAMIANPRDLIHYRLEPGEFELLDLMDGTRTVEEIVLDRLHESGDMELSGVIDLVLQLRVGNFLDPTFNDADGALVDKILPPPGAWERILNFARTLRVDWVGAERLVVWLYDRGLKFGYTTAGIMGTAGIAVAGFIAFLVVLAGGQARLSGHAAAAESIVIIVLNILLVFIHELGHATALLHFKRRIKSAGFLIYFGSPAFFIESSESLMLDRRGRIVQSAIGPYAQAVFAGLAALLALLIPDSAVGRLAFRIAALNYFVILMNLIPLLELDGYWILSDAIQVPDLRPKSLSFIRHDLIHRLRKREKLTRQEWGLTAYGILGVAFTIFSFYTAALFWRTLFGGLVSSLWHGGIHGRAILLVLALFIFGPILRGMIGMGRWIGRRGQMIYRQIRFKLETKWRVEAAQLIDALPLFEDIPVEALNDLAGAVQLKHFSAGQAVVRQGERATTFYVVRRGTLHVVDEADRANGNERVLRVLGRGESFGELAVVNAAPRRATVRAAENTEVFEIDKSGFDRLMTYFAEMPDLLPTFQDMAELRELGCFSHLEQDELSELLEFGEWVMFSPGEVIVKQGTVADAFYAIRAGQVDIVDRRTVVNTLGPGAYFGEVGLLKHVRRTATVRARTSVRLYRLSSKGFDRLVRGAFKKGTLDPNIKARRSSTH